MRFSGDEGLGPRLAGATAAIGRSSRRLWLAGERCRISGLDDGLARDLDRRYGGFVDADPVSGTDADDVTLAVCVAGGDGWLRDAGRGGPYRLEPWVADSVAVVLSDFWALADLGGTRSWKLALTRPSIEPTERAVDNALRLIVARRALERGGFALHAAGVLHRGVAHLLAGPSRSGKSTAARLADDGWSLGDDFGVIVAAETDWVVPALPFDNAERIEGLVRRELFPLGRVWRIHQAKAPRVELPPAGIASASLLACTAFPWVFPEASGILADRVQRLVREGRFAHLHVALGRSLWDQIDPG